jgi:hypothetical protein
MHACVRDAVPRKRAVKSIKDATLAHATRLRHNRPLDLLIESQVDGDPFAGVLLPARAHPVTARWFRAGHTAAQ